MQSLEFQAQIQSSRFKLLSSHFQGSYKRDVRTSRAAEAAKMCAEPRRTCEHGQGASRERDPGEKFKVQSPKFKVRKARSSKFEVQSSKGKVQCSKFTVHRSKFEEKRAKSNLEIRGNGDRIRRQVWGGPSSIASSIVAWEPDMCDALPGKRTT